MDESGISLRGLSEERQRLREQLATAVSKYLASGKPQDGAIVGNLARRSRLLSDAYHALRREPNE